MMIIVAYQIGYWEKTVVLVFHSEDEKLSEWQVWCDPDGSERMRVNGGLTQIDGEIFVRQKMMRLEIESFWELL